MRVLRHLINRLNSPYIIAYLILVAGVCGYVYRMERRQQALQAQINHLDHNARTAVGILVQALAQLQQRFVAHESRGAAPEGMW